MFTDFLDTPIGRMRISGNEEGLCNCDFSSGEKSSGDAPLCIRQAKFQLQKYFNGELKEFTCKLNPKGTDFQLKVWNEIKKIKFGETTSYRDIALSVGTVKYSRAVANAVGKNPILIIVPCHRVIGADGTITGYSAGIERKQYLLSHEQ